MPYAKPDGTILDGDGRGALQAAFPNVSIPHKITPEALAAIGVVETSPRPHDTITDTFDWDGTGWVATPRKAAAKAKLRARWEREQIEKIKAEAQRQITDDLPSWKQANLVLDWGELLQKRADGETLTAEERARAIEIRAARQQIRAIRAASDAIEAEVKTADPATFDPIANPHWPGYVAPEPVVDPPQ